MEEDWAMKICQRMWAFLPYSMCHTCTLIMKMNLVKQQQNKNIIKKYHGKQSYLNKHLQFQKKFWIKRWVRRIGKEYNGYLIKWKNHPIEDSTWMTIPMQHKSGVIVEDLMDRSPWIIFFSWEWDVGASPQKSSYVKLLSRGVLLIAINLILSM